MEIKITTYINNEKVHDEKYVGEYIVENTYEKIQYIDKNEKKIKIFIDKMTLQGHWQALR